MKLLFWKKW